MTAWRIGAGFSRAVLLKVCGYPLRAKVRRSGTWLYAHTPPTDKHDFGIAVGNELAKTHGKKPYYKPREVKRAAESLGYPIDWHCWAMCVYVSPEDFEAYHQSIGEVCDYAAMKASMVFAITDGVSDTWFNIDMSWLDWPDIDLGSIFDFDIF